MAREWNWTTWLRRLALPLSGMAALTLALVLALLPAHPIAVTRPVAVAEAEGDEMEMASEDMDATTFRDDDHNVTMVWFSDRRRVPSLPAPNPLLALLPDEALVIGPIVARACGVHRRVLHRGGAGG